MFEKNFNNGIVNAIETNAVNLAGRIIKTKFTIPIKVTSNSIEYIKYIDLLKKIDKNFKKHTVELEKRYYVDGIFTISTHKGPIIVVYGYPQIGNDERTSDIFYTLEMYLVGPNSLNILRKIKRFIESRDNNGKGAKTIPLYEITGESSGWSSVKSYIDKREFDTMFFDGNIKEDILEHIDNWEKCEDVFAKRGLTHKTGILVYGKPGTGKSTLAKALASELDYSLISIDTSTFDNINLVELTNAINNDNMKSVIFIDEIDTIFKSRDDDSTDDQKARVNKLLSFLDGVNSPNHTVFIATTNYFDKLDAAVKRKGRFDKIIELTDINKDTAKRMCKSFGLSDYASNEVLSKYKTKNINPADLQDKIITNIRKELAEK